MISLGRVIIHYKFVICALVCTFFIVLKSNAQDVRVNEIVSSNSVLLDQDGDTPDWFELHNFGSTAVSLYNWSVSDNPSNPRKWVIPKLNLQPNSYLMVWASKKDRYSISFYRTIITAGNLYKYISPTSEPSTDWNTLSFDDAAWSSGVSGFGYGDGDDATHVPQGTRSVYLRKKFTLSDAAQIENLILDIDYDDAFVAYINGVEVGRANIQGIPPAYNATPSTDHEAQIYSGGKPDRFIVENVAAFLTTGENVFCIQAHNLSATSSDFTVIPYLSASYSSAATDGSEPPLILGISDTYLHTNFKISLTETLSLYNPQGSLVSSLLVDKLPADNSIGITESGTIAYFLEPTPVKANTSKSFIGVTSTEIDFSHQGGATQPLSLTMNGISENETIRYTLDATEPNKTSAVYGSAISIHLNTVVRAKVYQSGFVPSRTQTRSYLMSVSHSLPIVSLVSAPDNFFNNQTGIYVHGDSYNTKFPYFGSNFWADWERPISFSFYETNGTLGAEVNCGTKIFGGWSRGNAQRSLALYARNRYGFSELSYPYFPQLNYTRFQSVILRNSGNDWLRVNYRDVILTSLMDGSGLETQAYRSVATYINAQYWGMYHMREKITEDYLAAKHSTNTDDIDLLELRGAVIHGSNTDYLALVNYLDSTSLVNQANYKYVTDQIDIDNFITYQVAQIYFNNTDWPGNNIKFWRKKTEKWRWILYDTDFGFGTWNNTDYNNNTLAFALEANSPGWPNPPWSTLLLRRLSQNEAFRNAFINQFADELNTRFTSQNVVNHINEMSGLVSAEIGTHFGRWSEFGPIWDWTGSLNKMKTFALNRPEQLRKHIVLEFNLLGTVELTVANADMQEGYVKVNSIDVAENLWKGIYFSNIPVRIKAIPLVGYRFSHWSGYTDTTDAEIELSLSDAALIIPHFEPAKELVINEINFKSGDLNHTGDWVELYNPRASAIDVSNWVVSDNFELSEYVVPTGTVIPGNGYLVVAKDLGMFVSVHPNLINLVGDFDFGLSNNGDAIRLFDENGILRDSVFYNTVEPWPTEANGTGATLELIDHELDNNLPGSWAILNTFGSPGELNAKQQGESSINIYNLVLLQNPFVDELGFELSLLNETELVAELYDIQGLRVHTFHNGKLGAGKHTFSTNLFNLSDGVYFLRIEDALYSRISAKWIKSQ